MTLHLVKLCVGCDTLEELAAWQSQRLAECVRLGNPPELMHVTRQTPRRAGFAPGSSIYWVIAGFIRAHQIITELREHRGTDGIVRCALVFEPRLIPTEPVPRRPFQGWRYLPAPDAPPDLDPNAPRAEGKIPPQMRAALTELRLI